MTVDQLTVSQLMGLILGLGVVSGLIVHFVGRFIDAALDISDLFSRKKSPKS
jgi:hypothetical protein